MVATELTDGLTVGVQAVWPLVILPAATAVLAYLVLRGVDRDRSASKRSRRLLFASRLLIVVLLVAGAMGPYSVQTRETPGEPRVTMLVDDSASMGVYPNVTGDLAATIESMGVPVTTATVASGADSRLGDGLVANLRENGTIVAVSDGRVTAGRALGAVTETARSLNATVSALDVEPSRTERAVRIDGPATASVGLRTVFTISVSGVGSGTVPVELSIDGTVVETADRGVDGTLTVNHTFEETGPHRLTARIDSGDRYGRNDIFYHAVRVVEQPELLYVAGEEYQLRGYLASLYDVTNATSVPDDLTEYAAVVVQNSHVARLGNVSALQEYVIGGGGLVVVGGENAYENGGYEESPLAALLPVSIGNATGGTSNLALAIDISGSTRGNLSTQKAIALDVLDQLGGDNRVGVVAFGADAYRIANLQRLADGRETIADRIRRLQIATGGGGGTDIGAGLLGAAELLGDRSGTIILLSDGWAATPTRPVAVANQLGREGHRVLTVGAARRVNVPRMKQIAAAAGGSYFGAGDRSRLRLLFGGSARRLQGENLTIVTPDTFITSGVTLTADPGRANEVAVKSGADYQVATAEGTPAIASWRFGLGRVVSITAYGADGGLDGLLERPDSLVLTKSVNYAVGDPSRTREGVSAIGDARVGRTTTLTYRGGARPSAPNVTFRQIGEGQYHGEFVPDRAGFGEILETTYAANYPVEYEQFGESPALEALVDATGGNRFAPDEPARIAQLARQQATQIRTVRDRWDWFFLLAAVVVFVTEVCARRVQVYRGRTARESGLP